jgi:hypothetical protein
MWRGYPEALGVYIAISCQVWARRKSARTGEFFSNKLMQQHIDTYRFGKNEAGQFVYQWEDGKATDEDSQEVDVATTTMTVAIAASALSAPASSTPAAAGRIATPAAAPAGGVDSHPRSGTYVDGVRVPWWFHDRRIHDSDAAILYHKDPKHYSAFKQYDRQYADYVWPRDINARHPEQAEELDELQAILDAEAAAKAATNQPKKASG